jgi:hypothetical protein
MISRELRRLVPCAKYVVDGRIRDVAARKVRIRWLFVALLACVVFDVATPQLAGAFRVFDGAPSAVIAVPPQASASLATSVGSVRAPVRASVDRVPDTARLTVRRQRPSPPRVVLHVARMSPQPSLSSDSPEAD